MPSARVNGKRSGQSPKDSSTLSSTSRDQRSETESKKEVPSPWPPWPPICRDEQLFKECVAPIANACVYKGAPPVKAVARLWNDGYYSDEYPTTEEEDEEVMVDW